MANELADHLCCHRHAYGHLTRRPAMDNQYRLGFSREGGAEEAIDDGGVQSGVDFARGCRCRIDFLNRLHVYGGQREHNLHHLNNDNRDSCLDPAITGLESRFP